MKICKIIIAILIIFLVCKSVVYANLDGYTVVIDPGHGGHDPGSIGYNNIDTNPPRNHRAFTQDRYTLLRDGTVTRRSNGIPDFFEHTGINPNDPNFNPADYPIVRFSGENGWIEDGFESIITLQIANELSRRLVAANATVSLTRNDDTFVELDERRDHANHIANNITGRC